MTTTPGSAGRAAARSDWIEAAGRIGLVAKGVSYALIGALAVQVAFGQRSSAEDRQGVLRQLAGESWGAAALVALAVGFGAYALWCLVNAVLDRQREGHDASGLAARAKFLGLAVLYGVTAAAAIGLVRSASSSAGGGSEERETARVLEWPAGRWIVLAVAAGFVSYGAFNVYRGVTRKFRERLREAEMGRAVKPWAIGSGVVGFAARGLVFGLVGVFLGKAAIEYDPDEAVGLDGALLELAEQPHGKVLLAVVAAGLVAYGVYCLVEARYRDV
ncbi:MAG TPA: DUF1206 domain-containing protein [Acidimicrobiales bacterium]